jgi:hypothetical protein
MKKLLGVAAILGAVAVGAAVSPAHANPPCVPLDLCAGPCPILIQFDANAFAHETAYSTTTFISTAGSQLDVVGLITQFGPALSFLNPNDPNKEYTFHLTALTSQGTKLSANGPTTLYDCDYDSLTIGTFTIHEGTPRNSPATAAAWAANPYGGVVVPATHDDGTIILSGVLCGFHTNIAKTGLTVSGSFRSNYHVTGGTLYPYIAGTEGLLGGNWCANLSGCHPANYSAHPNGKFDASNTVTPASRSTWGRIKVIYH